MSGPFSQHDDMGISPSELARARELSASLNDPGVHAIVMSYLSEMLNETGRGESSGDAYQGA